MGAKQNPQDRLRGENTEVGGAGGSFCAALWTEAEEARQPERMMGNRHPLKAAKVGQIMVGGRVGRSKEREQMGTP